MRHLKKRTPAPGREDAEPANPKRTDNDPHHCTDVCFTAFVEARMAAALCRFDRCKFLRSLLVVIRTAGGNPAARAETSVIRYEHTSLI